MSQVLRVDKQFWTRLVLAAFALGTLVLLGSAIAIEERTHSQLHSAIAD